MTKIPVLIIDKLEIGKGEFLFDKGREFIKHRLCPMAYKDNKLVDVPSHTASGYLGIVALEFCILMFCLRLEVFLHPYVSVKMRIILK